MVSNKVTIILASTLLFLILLSTFVLAYAKVDIGHGNHHSGNRDDEIRRLCLEEDQSIPNDRNPTFTCENTLCVICVNSRGSIVDLDQCDDVPFCSPIQDLDFVDNVPPAITVFKPLEAKVYHDRRVELHVETDEFSKIELLDSSESGTRERRLCSNCIIYKNKLSLREGFHTLVFRATDNSGNFADHHVNIAVDSKEPRISRVYPRRHFANGEFTVEFREDNPNSIKLFYGNTLTGFNTLELSPSECTFYRNRRQCTTFVDLFPFQNQGIDYWFSVEDIAGNQDVSRIERLEVDTLPPIIHNLNLNHDRRRVELTVDVSDSHFAAVEYLDENNRSPRFKRLCTRLNYIDFERGLCSRKLTLRKGPHNLIIRAIDAAGNFADEEIQVIPN